IKKEELTKKINFIKPQGTYKNNASGAWTELYVCSYAGEKQVHYDYVEEGNSQKKHQ
ncbi:16165_t:CDS:1, partial [Cetraspora pellucida]